METTIKIKNNGLHIKTCKGCKISVGINLNPDLEITITEAGDLILSPSPIILLGEGEWIASTGIATPYNPEITTNKK